MSDDVDVIELATKKFSAAEIGRTTTPIFRFTCEVHCADKNLSFAEQVYTRDVAVFRDYEDNYGDLIEVSIVFPLGTFMYDVYDGLENLEITLKERTQFYRDTKAKIDNLQHFKTTRYKAIFLKDKNKALPTTRALSRADLNQQIPVVVVFQLIEKSVEAIRIKTSGGSFSNGNAGVTPEQFLRTTLSKEIDRIQIDNEPAIDVFDIVPFDNKDLIKQILIPTHTRIVEIPDYLQEKLGGIYNDGLSCYVQTVMTKPGTYKNTFALFNLYNPDSEGVADSVIYCMNSGSKTAQFLGGIHDKSGIGIHLLAHRLSGIEDDKSTKVLNQGTGFRVADASKVMDAPVVYKASGAEFNRKETTTEIVGDDRDDGGNFASNKGIGHNNLALTTDVFKRSAKYVTLQVSNLDHSILPPGKKYEIHYLSTETLPDGKVNKKMLKRYAYILQVLSVYSNNNPDLIANNNGAYVELTNHTTLKMVVGKVINTQTP